MLPREQGLARAKERIAGQEIGLDAMMAAAEVRHLAYRRFPNETGTLR